MNWIRKHKNLIVAFVAAGASTAWSAWSDHHITTVEAVLIATAYANAVIVYVCPNLPDARWLKTAASGVLAILGLLATDLQAGSGVLSGLTADQWTLIAVSAVGVLGIHVTNNVGDYADTVGQPLVGADDPGAGI